MVLQNKQIVTGSGVLHQTSRAVVVILALTPEDREDVVKEMDTYATIMFYGLIVPGLGQRGLCVLTMIPHPAYPPNKTSVLVSPNHPEPAIVHVGVIE